MRMKRAWMVGVCVGLMGLGVRGESAPPCAVLSFQGGEGIGVGEAGMLANRVSAVMASTERFALLPRYVVHRSLQAAKMDNPYSPDYAINAGKALDVPYVVFGSAGRKDGALELSLALLDVNSGESLKTVKVAHAGDLDSFMLAAPVEAVQVLLGQETVGGEMPVEPTWQAPAAAAAAPAPVAAEAGVTEPKPAPQRAVASPTPRAPKQVPVPAPVAVTPPPAAVTAPKPVATQPAPVRKPPVRAAPAAKQPAPAVSAESDAYGQTYGTAAGDTGRRIGSAFIDYQGAEELPASWESESPMYQKIYWNLIRDRIEIGLRQTEFDLDTTFKNGPGEDDQFLGTIDHLDEETDSSFDKWFIRYFPIPWMGFELATDEVSARTITMEDGHSDGVFVAEGNVLTTTARLSLGDVLRVVDWASNGFEYPGRAAYAWGDRLRVYYGVGSADFSVDFDEDTWWALGYPSEQEWLDDGSPTSRSGGRRRKIDCTDESGDVTTLGFSVYLTRYLFLDFYTRDMELSSDATYDRSDATAGPITRPIPLDNKATGFGLGFVF
jgi:hypothetical protein